MKKIYKSGAVLVALSVFALVFVFSSDVEMALPQHVVLARELEAHVRPENNSYQHRPSIVKLKGIHGSDRYVCHTDCSGLVGALFRYSYGYTKEDLRHWLQRPSGRGISFFEAVSHDRGFRRIEQVQDILPGDILTYKLPPGAGNYGHVMIVNEKPRQIEQRRWAVGIIDCTGKGHGTTDSRYLGDNRYHSGIGKGDVCIYSDQDGTITGFAWNTASSTKCYTTDMRPFVVGRLTSYP